MHIYLVNSVVLYVCVCVCVYLVNSVVSATKNLLKCTLGALELVF